MTLPAPTIKENVMKKVLLLIVLAGTTTLGWLQWQQPSAAQQQPSKRAAPVTTFELQPTVFQDQITALGTLRARESVDITTSVAQIVTELKFEDGQTVKKGQVLAVLKQDAELATEKELQATLQDAEREVRRLQNLARQNQVAQMDLDKARTQFEVVQHQIEQTQSRLADRTIVAPFTGVLGMREVSEGALLSPGETLTTLDDVSSMRLDFTIPSAHLGFLHIGQPVTATTQAYPQQFKANISAINSRVDPVARAAAARAILANPEQLLRPGLLMEVTIAGPERQVLLAPEESLESRALEHYLWRIEGDKAYRTRVTIGSRRPGWVEIVEGLRAGDVIVRDGVGSLIGNEAPIKRVEE
jgi:membrane fusion protein (multidrug efflux system)